ncbi:MAG: response regulator [Tannerella sp.]|jgi:signal transduction histidine kinase/ligand-binding sensor domain-containing protein/AraC-like DNA-binding protein|nr:response regulator [Tannerella sp.]
MKGFIVIIFAIFGLSLSAQKSLFFTSEKELSSSLINAIYQDRRDYIWVATEDGLNRYDGNRFTTYKNIPNDSTSLRNNYIRSLFEDSRGRFWIGCINALHLYDRRTDRFREVKLYNNGVRIYPHITSIIECREGEIWVATSGEGIIRINDLSDTIQTYNRLSTRLSSLHLSCIFQDSRGLLWIASENQGLNMYDPVNDSLTIFKEPEQIGGNQISSICEDAEGCIFVGTLTNGLYKYNGRKRLFEYVPYEGGKILPVKTLMVDNRKRLFTGTDGDGLKIYNPETNQLEDFMIKSAPFDFSKMKVHAICQDKMGNIWTGLFQKGVFLEPENPNKFEYWGSMPYNQGVTGSDCVMSLLKDSRDNLWIGTDNDGIYRIGADGLSKHFAGIYRIGSEGSAKHFAADAAKHFTADAGTLRTSPVPNTVLSMTEDDDGNIWLGSYLQGLSCIEASTGLCRYYDYDESRSLADYNDNANTARNKIFALKKDTRNYLWIGTSGAGVYVFDLAKHLFVKHYSQYLSDGQTIPNDWINCITEDSRHLIWIGSYQGFFSIDPASGEVKHYTKENGALPGNIVYYITEDPRGNLWVGTTEGLAYFDVAQGTSTVYTTADGLSSNVVCGILVESAGAAGHDADTSDIIWISTHSGISEFVVAEGKFINYYGSDGLQSNEFSLGAALKSADGKMFFGGINGVTSFNPQDINDQRIPPALYLTALYVMDKPVVAGQKSGSKEIISDFIADVDTIRLSHKDNMFALEFSTFYYGFSERVRYEYFLEGLSAQWMATDPGVNRIGFTNISYGTYKLKVKAAIYNSASSAKEITLIIYPPWYLTWWAKLVYFILTALLAVWIYFFISDNIRHKNEMLRREHAEQINESKLQFFINVSHEIRTPMTLIISPLEKLISDNKDSALQKSYLLIYRNARRILQLINQLMDVRKIDKGLMSIKMSRIDIVGFIDDLMQSFEFQADRRHIKFDFVHTDERLEAWIDLNNFDKVLFNILSNAFKFTPEDGEVSIRLTTGYDATASGALHEYFEIRVADTGPGIEEDKIERIFERFYQIEGSGNNFGTGIGLHLARSLVMLQHGVIHARNRQDLHGSEFIIRMPLGNEHISDVERENVRKDAVHKDLQADKIAQLADADAGRARVKSKTKYRVMVIDDEDEIRDYLQNELSDTFKISATNNGKDALSIILKEKPNLVISDVMMPEMDGITLVRKMKSNVNIKHIPVLLLTAKATDTDIAEGFETGADAYVTKPFNIELLKKRIISIIENRERLEPRISDGENSRAMIKPVVLRPSDELLYEKIMKLVNDNIADPDLNVEFIANGAGMSRVHLHRKLKELTNQSARDFIRTIRLNQAAELLKNPKLTVSEVAYALGFTNLSHFSTSFREFHGMSPKEFKEGKNKLEL